MAEKSPQKIVIVTTLLPYTNYGRFLCQKLNYRLKDLIIYTDKNHKNKTIKKCGLIKPIWPKNFIFAFKILKEIKKDNPDIIHFQHELNMYPGYFNALFFPILIFILKNKKNKTVVTFHAVVKQEIVNKKFINYFSKNKFIKPFFLKIFFLYLYKITGFFGDKIIVHTDFFRKILIEDYKIDPEKVEMIPHGVPLYKKTAFPKSNYFLYFGYLSGRKGLIKMIKGFQKFSKNNISWKLILAGGAIKGQEFSFKKIKPAIHKNGSKNIELAGFINRKEITKLFQKAYAVIIPSEISISASGPLALALGYGKGILVSDIENLNEEITDNKDGLIIKNDNWANGFEIATRNPNLMTKIEKGAFEKAKKRSWNKVARKHLTVYKHLCND